MADDLYRQWALLRLVPRAPRRADANSITAALSAAGFDTNRRMVQRDLHRLSLVFPLVLHDSHRPHGWCWAKDSNPFDTLGMDPAAAVAVQLMDLLVARLLPAALRDALAPSVALSSRVLAELGTDSGAKFASKVRLASDQVPLTPPMVPPEVLEAVTTALYRGRQLDVRYVRRNEQEVRSYVLSPVGLVSRGVVLVLAAATSADGPVKSYLVHRMDGAVVLESHLVAPPNFNLDAWIESGSMIVK